MLLSLICLLWPLRCFGCLLCCCKQALLESIAGKKIPQKSKPSRILHQPSFVLHISNPFFGLSPSRRARAVTMPARFRTPCNPFRSNRVVWILIFFCFLGSPVFSRNFHWSFGPVAHNVTSKKFLPRKIHCKNSPSVTFFTANFPDYFRSQHHLRRLFNVKFAGLIHVLKSNCDRRLLTSFIIVYFSLEAFPSFPPQRNILIHPEPDREIQPNSFFPLHSL